MPVIEQVAFGALARCRDWRPGGRRRRRRLERLLRPARRRARERGAAPAASSNSKASCRQQRAMASRTRRARRSARTSSRAVTATTLAARVIAGNPSPGALTVTIDRGTDDGVEPNMAVIGGRGVVGRVIGRPSHARGARPAADRSAAAPRRRCREERRPAASSSAATATAGCALELRLAARQDVAGRRAGADVRPGRHLPAGLPGRTGRVGRRAAARTGRSRSCRPSTSRTSTSCWLSSTAGQVGAATSEAHGRPRRRCSSPCAAGDAGPVHGRAAAGCSTWCWSASSSPRSSGRPVAGMLAGTLGGLLQDMLSGGIVGVGGLAKTLVGFAAGRGRHPVRGRQAAGAGDHRGRRHGRAPADDARRSRA